MAFTQSPSVSNNPKIPTYYLIFAYHHHHDYDDPGKTLGYCGSYHQGDDFALDSIASPSTYIALSVSVGELDSLNGGVFLLLTSSPGEN